MAEKFHDIMAEKFSNLVKAIIYRPRSSTNSKQNKKRSRINKKRIVRDSNTHLLITDRITGQEIRVE